MEWASAISKWAHTMSCSDAGAYAPIPGHVIATIPLLILTCEESAVMRVRGLVLVGSEVGPGTADQRRQSPIFLASRRALCGDCAPKARREGPGYGRNRTTFWQQIPPEPAAPTQLNSS